MSELGGRLRQAREGQGFSLAQASVDTRILQQSLIALEEGAYQRLPGDVVIRGFIRNYAQYLGLSPEDMIDIYRRERGTTDKIQIVAATNPPRSRSYVLPNFFGVFFVTIALVGLTYVSLSAIGRIGSGGIASVPVVAATSLVVTPSPLSTPTLPQSSAVVAVRSVATRTIRTVATPSSRPAGGSIMLTTTPVAPITFEVRIVAQGTAQGSWVRVQADGVTLYEGVMSNGQRRTFQAQRGITIRAGNPPAVMVSVNGVEQGSLGQIVAQPVDWSWPPN